MLLELAAGGFLLGEYVYHRWFEEQDGPKPPDIRVPQMAENGGAAPLIYGRVRVHTPYVAWYGNPQYSQPGTTDPEPSVGRITYGLDMFFVMGIPFQGGVNRIHGIFVENMGLESGGVLSTLTGDGNFETTAVVTRSAPSGDPTYKADPGFIGGRAEFLNGNASQQLVDQVTPFAATTWIGLRLSSNPVPGAPNVISGVPGGPETPSHISGYRGYMSVFLHGESLYHSGVPADGWGSWFIGTQPQPGSYNFECSSYPLFPLVLSGPSATGVEANPADVLYDLLAGKFGKLQLDNVSTTSFRAAANAMVAEGLGFSRAWEQVTDAQQMIEEVLRTIDGIIYEDPRDGLIKLKLVRGDYTIANCREINPDNCEELQDYASGGWDDLVTSVRVTFTDRENEYRESSATAQNQACADAQDGQIREQLLTFLGLCTKAQAETVAARELAARSRPIVKCRAIVDQTFFDVVPGDVVRLSWPDANISDLLMRVAAVGRGDRRSSKVALDLVQDTCSVRRNAVIPPTIAPFPTTVA